jgi:hypothetical protein
MVVLPTEVTHDHRDGKAAGLQTVDDDATTFGPILVATDGTASAEAALRAAAMLERHTGAGVVVLAVLEGLPLIAADYGMLIPPIDSDESRRQALQERVRGQIEQASPQGARGRSRSGTAIHPQPLPGRHVN